MAAVGGVFHRRDDAQLAVDALTLAGVEPGEIRFEILPRSLVDVLGPLGIPAEAVWEYERNINPGDVLMLVNSEALPAVSIADEIARRGGLVLEFGWAPASEPGVR
ncbi:MAG TPA: hypothetical protein VKX96_01070 [Chloroflexota bacterium]|jgi:hypothetical protein|nr:hypothetical protein [Chloroflexota bacterium]